MNQAECSAMESTRDMAKRLAVQTRSCIRGVAGDSCENEAMMQAERVPCHVAIDDRPFSDYTDEQCVLVVACLLYREDQRRGGYPFSVNPTETLLRPKEQRSLEATQDRLKILRSRCRQLDFIWAALDPDSDEFGKQVLRYESMKSRCGDEIQSLVCKIKDIHNQGGPSLDFESHGVWNYVTHLLQVSMDQEGIAQAKQRGEAFVGRVLRDSELLVPGRKKETTIAPPPPKAVGGSQSNRTTQKLSAIAEDQEPKIVPTKMTRSDIEVKANGFLAARAKDRNPVQSKNELARLVGCSASGVTITAVWKRYRAAGGGGRGTSRTKGLHDDSQGYESELDRLTAEQEVDARLDNYDVPRRERARTQVYG